MGDYMALFHHRLREGMRLPWPVLPLLGALLLLACTTDGAIESGDYPVLPITPELVAQQRAARASAQAATPPPAPLPPRDYTYRIAPGDMLSFRLWDGFESTSIKGFSNISDQMLHITVEEDGTANFPYAGALKVSGQTAQSARKLLGKSLSRYFNTPRFDLQVAEFHGSRVTISGAVMKPGVQYLGYEPLTIAKALAEAGGPQPFADLAAIELIHADGKREVIDGIALLHRGNIAQDRPLAAGDTLLLRENHRNRVFLMGDVIKPGSVYIPAGTLSLTEALSGAPGTDGNQAPNIYTATPAHVYVIRGAAADAGSAIAPTITIYQLDPELPMQYAIADQFLLEPRDVVYVSASAVTEWHRFITQLLPGNLSTTKTFD